MFALMEEEGGQIYLLSSRKQQDECESEAASVDELNDLHLINEGVAFSFLYYQRKVVNVQLQDHWVRIIPTLSSLQSS